VIAPEKDPAGLDLATPGAKADAGKLRPALVLGSFWPGLTLVADRQLLVEHIGEASTREADCIEVFRRLAARDIEGTVMGCLAMASRAGLPPLNVPAYTGQVKSVADLFRFFGPGLKGVVDIGTRGASKYSDDGWMHVPNGVERYRDALGRHTLDLFEGEVNDRQWGTPHAHHMAWNALAWATLHMRGVRPMAVPG